jgi:myo-inositol-1(or 4)-monophosphatase
MGEGRGRTRGSGLTRARVSEQEELLRVAIEAAQSAGQLLIERFNAPARGVETKSTPTDLVSDADRDSEGLILDMISSRRPADGIVAEEGGGKRSRSGYRWIVDPLDGTVNFLYHIPTWAVSIAAEDDDGVTVGVIHDPNHNETFAAVRGRGSKMNGSHIRVSDQTDLAQALIGTGFAYDTRIRAAQAEVVRTLLQAVRDIRRAGSAALDLASLACGRLDGFYEANMEVWDRAAGVLIATEAGAKVTDLQPPLGASVGVVAANPELHDLLRSLVV